MCRVCRDAGRLACSNYNTSMKRGDIDNGGEAFDTGVYARRAKATLIVYVGGGELDGSSGHLVVGPTLPEEQKRMADLVRGRVRGQRQNQGGTGEDVNGGEKDDELIGGMNGKMMIGGRRLDRNFNSEVKEQGEGVVGAMSKKSEKLCKRCFGTVFIVSHVQTKEYIKFPLIIKFSL